MNPSLKYHTVDVVLVRKKAGPIPRPLPDGFEDLATYNLMTFRSHQETLDAWTLTELVADYVDCRKKVSPQELLPETDFRLFAVCVCYPHELAERVALTPVRTGVYEVRLATLPIRIIVIQQLPQEENNAMLHLFGAREDLLRYGKEHYQPRSKETSTLL